MPIQKRTYDKLQVLQACQATCLIMTQCIWLAGGQNNGPNPQHLCGVPHHCELADYQKTYHNASGVLELLWLAATGQKQGQVHKPHLIGWAQPKKLWVRKAVFIGCHCLILLVNGCLGGWHWDNWERVRRHTISGNLCTFVALHFCRFSDL